jgi:AbrB family looped-hinge helix DNA binding protein
MRTAVTIDRAGRVVLPHQVRRHFHLEAGGELDLEVVADGIFLRSRSAPTGLVEEDGLLVHEGEATGDLASAVEFARTSRDADVLGSRR